MNQQKLTAAFLIFFLIAVCPVWAAEERDAAEELMTWQLDAIVEDDSQKFTQKGNHAFKEMMADFIFDSLTMQYGAQLKKGYSLHYLGTINRRAMTEYLWKVSLTDHKYELLGSITIAKEFVVGFRLD